MSDSTPTLEPCPFCGGEADGPVFVCEMGRWDVWAVCCQDCDFNLENRLGEIDAKSAAITRWNTRAALDASGNDELVEALNRANAALRWVYVNGMVSDPMRPPSVSAAFNDAFAIARTQEQSS